MYPTYLWGKREYSSEIASSLSGQLLFLGVRSAAPKLLCYQLGMKPQEAEGRGKGRAGSWGRVWASMHWKLDVPLNFSLRNCVYHLLL